MLIKAWDERCGGCSVGWGVWMWGSRGGGEMNEVQNRNLATFACLCMCVRVGLEISSLVTERDIFVEV